MLKLLSAFYSYSTPLAAASARLCVETMTNAHDSASQILQPPPRGCVLKHFGDNNRNWRADAAASARLCVETENDLEKNKLFYAAASARLCVETFRRGASLHGHGAAASARLCVETLYSIRR